MISATDLDSLKRIVNDTRHDSDSLLQYGRDWSRLHEPSASAITFPRSSTEVQALVQWANKHQIALVPSGGRTGMSGGALAQNGEVVVSFERMNKILQTNTDVGSITVQPGVITQTLQNHAYEQGLHYPVDFGSRGSSHIGGNIATNAGGIKVIRYGMTRDWVTGLKVVTGKGDLLDLNKGLIKNATGYDFRHLFIGSEGTLGFIVEATLQMTRLPQQPKVMVLALPNHEAIMPVFGLFRQQIELNAFEFFTDRCVAHVTSKGVPMPFEQEHPYYVLIEFDSPSSQAMEQALNIFEQCIEQSWAVDGVVSESEQQAKSLWRLREDITESIAEFLPYKNDVSVPVAHAASFMADTDAMFAGEYPDFEILWFGHVGDGNLHINILKPEALNHAEFVQRCEQVNQLLFANIAKYQGSISAEHGVGLTKKPYLSYTRDAIELEYMRSLKQVFDPNNIINPGKIFD